MADRKLKLNLAYLYPDIMNLYADRGNVIALSKRCEWHGINLAIDKISLGGIIEAQKYDLVFIGGGQDKEQRLVCNDLAGKKEALTELAEDGGVMLAVCGGYQLFGRYYRPADAPELPGLGILDIETVAGNRRLIGNVVVETDFADCFNAGDLETSGLKLETRFQRLEKHQMNQVSRGPKGRTSLEHLDAGFGLILVGFENHSGKTYLGSGVKPLGRVRIGFGNNGEDGTEGAVYKNVFGTYLHGSLLPKNPWFTDHLIKLALERRYGEAELRQLDDGLEMAAHQAAIARARAVGWRARFIPEWLRR